MLDETIATRDPLEARARASTLDSASGREDREVDGPGLLRRPGAQGRGSRPAEQAGSRRGVHDRQGHLLPRGQVRPGLRPGPEAARARAHPRRAAARRARDSELRVSDPNEASEKQAEKTAEKVTAPTGSSTASAGGAGGSVGRVEGGRARDEPRPGGLGEEEKEEGSGPMKTWRCRSRARRLREGRGGRGGCGDGGAAGVAGEEEEGEEAAATGRRGRRRRGRKRRARRLRRWWRGRRRRGRREEGEEAAATGRRGRRHRRKEEEGEEAAPTGRAAGGAGEGRGGEEAAAMVGAPGHRGRGRGEGEPRPGRRPLRSARSGSSMQVGDARAEAGRSRAPPIGRRRSAVDPGRGRRRPRRRRARRSSGCSRRPATRPSRA